MGKFCSALWGLFKAHPLLSVLLVVAIVLVLGGVVWWALRALFSAIRKVPGGSKVADAASDAVNKLATATGSA